MYLFRFVRPPAYLRVIATDGGDDDHDDDVDCEPIESKRIEANSLTAIAVQSALCLCYF